MNVKLAYRAKLERAAEYIRTLVKGNQSWRNLKPLTEKVVRCVVAICHDRLRQKLTVSDEIRDLCEKIRQRLILFADLDLNEHIEQ
jgi:Ethanolamine utilization protein EutJ (predicted chaperonin)